MTDPTRRCCFSMVITTLAVAALLLTALCGGCKRTERDFYQDGKMKMDTQDFQGAITAFDESLKLNPKSKSALFGKVFCLVKLKQFKEALPLAEQFLKDTDNNEFTATFVSERRDAEFYRDKCKQELGIEVPQNPDDIPPPPMGE